MPRQLIRDFGTCIRFNGTSTRIVLPHHAAYNFGAGDFTVAVWLRTSDFVADRTIFYAFNTDTNNGWSMQASGNAGKVQFGLYSGGGDQAVTVATDRIDNNLWNFVIGERSGTTTTLYINNVAQATPGTGGNVNVNNGGSKYIGSNLTPAKFFIGWMDKPVWLNRVLTAAEKEHLFYGTSPVTSGRVLNLELDEGSGTTAIDSSATANNGTITSGTYSTDVFIKPRIAI